MSGSRAGCTGLTKTLENAKSRLRYSFKGENIGAGLALEELAG